MLEKKIALLTSVTFNNIGNGFIDLGAEAALMKALPLNAELFKVSSNANFAATMGQMFMLKENPIINWLWVHTMQRAAKKLHDRSYKTVKTQNIFSMASMVKCDYFIIPGCACIPTLAFGNKARLFSNSPRIALFENAKIPDVRERLVSIEGLKEMQDKQIAFLASLLQ